MHCPHTLFLEAGFQGDVEVRRINADEQRRSLLKHAPCQLSPNGNNAGVMTQHLSVTTHRKAFHRKPGIEAGCLHAGAADARESCLWQAFAQGSNEMRPEEVS